MCFRCIERTAQRKKGKKDYGHFCIACAATQTDEGSDEANDAEVAALESSLQVDQTPTGERERDCVCLLRALFKFA